ncbi:metallopeptidase TldD-related protein [Amycolatopsis jejuensis]|uniref:metallopeptidase TldD-related protein n=1 Tax=Amycolatopsis jejuensis TaxID=330084 RepID=UPI0005262D7E|nr:metallopeptidase TldD-related protein [Amycolatopsis jejuensis]
MSEPQELVETALRASASDGCVVIATEETEVNLRWANSSLTTTGHLSSGSLTVTSIVDGNRAATVTGPVSSAEEAERLVRAADVAAAAAPPDDTASPLVAPDGNDHGWSGEPARTSIRTLDRFVPDLARAFDRCAGDEIALFGFAEHRMASTFVGSSTGLRRRFDQPTGKVTITGKSADLSRSTWAGLHTRDFTDIDVEATVDRIGRQLGWARKRIELPAGQYETILPPSAVADLMVFTYILASARAADEGRSPFSAGSGNRIGEQLSPHPLTLYSDPEEDGLQCPPFELVSGQPGPYPAPFSVFDIGQPATRVDWIDDGRLTDLHRSRAWAKRTAARPRPFVHNLTLTGAEGGPSLDDMVANTERGLLLTCLFYVREVDPANLLLTGLTRDGVYLVENGRIRGAVNNFRFNESPLSVLSRLTEVGRTEPTLGREWQGYFPRTAMPPIRVPDFTMSTVSQAL